jgi:hypothetical protein
MLVGGSNIGVNEANNSPLKVAEQGANFMLQAGYLFNRSFSLELSAGGYRHDTNAVDTELRGGTLQLAVKYRFLAQHHLRPYLKGGLGAYGLELDNGAAVARADGGGLAFGGGLDFFFNKHFSLGLDVTGNVIEYNNAELDLGTVIIPYEINEDSEQVAVSLAMNVYF